MNRHTAALDFIGSCLSTDESSGPTEADCSHIAALPYGWEAVVEVANDTWVAPALWTALERTSSSRWLPDDLCRYLSQLHRLNRRRNEKLKNETLDAVYHLNRTGIVPTLLKGSASLFTGVFQDVGDRMMRDIDILVRPYEIESARECLQTLRYTPYPAEDIDYRSHHHIEPLWRPGAVGSIELHRRAFYSVPSPLSEDCLFRAASRMDVDGASMNVLWPTHQALHSFWHSEVNDEHYELGDISIRYLHELVMLDVRYADAIDWTVIRSAVQPHGVGHVLEAYLYLAHRLMGMTLPDAVSPGVMSRLHYLRCRARMRSGWVRSFERASRSARYRLGRLASRWKP